MHLNTSQANNFAIKSITRNFMIFQDLLKMMQIYSNYLIFQLYIRKLYYIQEPFISLKVLN